MDVHRPGSGDWAFAGEAVATGEDAGAATSPVVLGVAITTKGVRLLMGAEAGTTGMPEMLLAGLAGSGAGVGAEPVPEAAPGLVAMGTGLPAAGATGVTTGLLAGVSAPPLAISVLGLVAGLVPGGAVPVVVPGAGATVTAELAPDGSRAGAGASSSGTGLSGSVTGSGLSSGRSGVGASGTWLAALTGEGLGAAAKQAICQ